MSKEIDRKWIMGELRESLFRLASPPEIALRSTPEGSLKTDEMALDYDNFLSAAIGNFPDHFTKEQLEVLISLNEKLSEISGSKNLELCSEESFLQGQEWESIRNTANKALKVLKW